MTYNEIVQITDEIGFPSAYDHFAEGASPDPPFLVFMLPSSANFTADDHIYKKGTEVALELYTDRKAPLCERQVENILNKRGIVWEKTETWIPDEKLFEVRYTFQVFYDEYEPD